MFAKKIYKNFCLIQKQITNNNLNFSNNTYPVALKYRNLEYKAKIDYDIKEPKIKDLLKSFSSNFNSSLKDFEIFRNGEYLSLDSKLANLKNEKFNDHPPTIVDFKLTLDNLKYRNLTEFKKPSSYHSQTFQNHLNSFLDENKTFLFKNFEETLKLKKTISNGSLNKLKLALVVASILKNNFKNLDLKLETNLNLQELEKQNKENIFIINILNDKKEILKSFPINLVLNTNNNNEDLNNQFDESIIDNLDTLKKLSLKNKTKNNIGFVTNLYKWKITQYIKPDDLKIETNKNFNISLFYDLPFAEASFQYLENNILLRVIKGIFNENDKI